MPNKKEQNFFFNNPSISFIPPIRARLHCGAVWEWEGRQVLIRIIMMIMMAEIASLSTLNEAEVGKCGIVSQHHKKLCMVVA